MELGAEDGASFKCVEYSDFEEDSDGYSDFEDEDLKESLALQGASVQERSDHDACPICLEPPEANDKTLLSCMHSLCLPCLAGWVKSRLRLLGRVQHLSRLSCPTCRAELGQELIKRILLHPEYGDEHLYEDASWALEACSSSPASSSPARLARRPPSHTIPTASHTIPPSHTIPTASHTIPTDHPTLGAISRGLEAGRPLLDITKAIAEARSFQLHLTLQRPAEEVLRRSLQAGEPGVVRAALAEARAVGVGASELLGQAEELLAKDAQRRAKALLLQAMERRVVPALCAALAEATSAGLDCAELQEARALVREERLRKVRVGLKKAMAGRSAGILYRSILEAQKAGLEDDTIEDAKVLLQRFRSGPKSEGHEKKPKQRKP